MRHFATFVLLPVVAVLVSCSPRLAVVNDTKEELLVDVIAKDVPREPFMRSLRAGAAMDAKICANEAVAIYVGKKGMPAKRFAPSHFCGMGKCGCNAELSNAALPSAAE